MKLIIAGRRDFDPNIVVNLIDSAIHHFGLNVTTVISGACGLDDADLNKEDKVANGVDGGGEIWCDYGKHYIKLHREYAKWTEQGLKAGPIRNAKMAQYADALLLIWDGKSRGSKNMKDNMIKLNKPIYEVILK